MDSRKISLVALFGAFSGALEIIPGVPMPGAPFLKFDVAEAPVLLLTLMLSIPHGLASLRGLAIAILSVKGDPIGTIYKVVATGSQLAFLRYLKDRPLPRLTSSALRAAFMTAFDRATIPLIRGVPVGLGLAAIIFAFNLVQGSINSIAALYGYELLKEGGMLCTLGLGTSGPATEERASLGDFPGLWTTIST